MNMYMHIINYNYNIFIVPGKENTFCAAQGQKELLICTLVCLVTNLQLPQAGTIRSRHLLYRNKLNIFTAQLIFIKENLH